jgi:hypothetical protein
MGGQSDLIDFEWWRDRRAPLGRFALIDSGSRIVWPGGPLQTYRPLDFGKEILSQFVTLRSSADALKFVNLWGLLSRDREPLDWAAGESVEQILGYARMMDSVYQAHARGGAGAVARYFGADGALSFYMSVEIAASESGRGVRFRYKPPSLIAAITLQCGLLIFGGAAFRFCGQCGVPFICGPGTEKRLDAKFCSEEHRYLSKSKDRSRRKP